MIDVKVLRAAGLTEAQIAVVNELVAPLIAELEHLRERKAVRREQNRKRQQDHRARQRDGKAVSVTCQRDIQKPNGINGHVSMTTGESSSFFFLESERKKESAKNFEQFYAAYPKHVAKIAAEKAYAKALKQATHAEIMAALEKQKPNFPEPKFIPHPASWLNAGRWLDEIKPVGIMAKFL